MFCYVCKGEEFDRQGNYEPTREHIIPRSKGGKNVARNYSVSHRICNTMRSSDENFFLWVRPEKGTKENSETKERLRIKIPSKIEEYKKLIYRKEPIPLKEKETKLARVIRKIKNPELFVRDFEKTSKVKPIYELNEFQLKMAQEYASF